MDDTAQTVFENVQHDSDIGKTATQNMGANESSPGIPKLAETSVPEVKNTEKSESKTAPYTVHVAIQACEYDMERRESILPTRRRTTPSRYRDYEDPDYIPDPDDEDYRPPVRSYGSGRGRGRPRKQNVIQESVVDDDGETDKAVKSQPGPDGQTRSLSANDSDHNSESFAGKRTRPRYIRIKSKTSENEYFKERPFRCLEEGCGQTFITANWLNRHKERKHQAAATNSAKPEDGTATDTKKSYSCPTCNKKFTLQGNLKTHMRSHSEEKQFCCDICPKFFSTADSLKRHKMSHLGIKPYECDECTAKFTSNVALREHKLIHKNLKPYQCAVCNRIFRQISVYQRHLLTHKGEMKFRCDICGRRFMQKIYLRSHMKKHTGERPYKCDLCEKRFAHASDKARHQKTHSGEKPYSCTVCQARFTDPSSCRRHMKEHNGALPFTCNKCGDKFKRKISLRTHINRQHGHELLHQAIMVTAGDNEVNNMDLCMIGGNKLVLLRPNGQQLPVMTEMLYSENNQQIVKLVEQKIGLKGEEPVILQTSDSTPEGHQIVMMPPPTENKVVISSDIKEEEPLPVTPQQIIEEIGSHLGTQEAILSSAEGQPVQVAYHVIRDDEHHHIVEIQYQPVEEMAGTDQTVVYQDENCEEPAAKSSGDGVSTTGSGNKLNNTDKVSPATKISFISSNNCEHKYAQDIEACAPLSVQLSNGGVLDSESCTKVENSLPVTGVEIITSNQADLEQEMLVNIQSGMEPSSGSTDLPQQAVMSAESNQSEEQNLLTSQPGSLITEAPQDVLTSHVTKMYIDQPDFSKQEYYNWLSLFSDQCKQTPVPLNEQMFRNISQLHKTLTDVMASPSGILAHRDNFCILMNISRDLHNIINEHLMCIYQNLENDS